MRLLSLIFVGVSILLAFNSHDYQILEDGRIKARGSDTYLCLDIDKKFFKCQSGKSIFKSIRSDSLGKCIYGKNYKYDYVNIKPDSLFFGKIRGGNIRDIKKLLKLEDIQTYIQCKSGKKYQIKPEFYEDKYSEYNIQAQLLDAEEAKRKKEEEAKRKKEEEAKRKKEAETKRKKEIEAKRKKEAEAKRKKEAEAKRKKEAEAKRKKEAEVKVECFSKSLDIRDNKLNIKDIQIVKNTRTLLKLEDGSQIKCGDSLKNVKNLKRVAKNIRGFGKCLADINHKKIICIRRELKTVIVYMPFGKENDKTFLQYLADSKSKRGKYTITGTVLGEFLENIKNQLKNCDIFIQHYSETKPYKFKNSNDIYRNIKKRLKEYSPFELDSNNFILLKKMIYKNKADIKIVFFSVSNRKDLKKLFCSNNSNQFKAKALVLNFAQDIEEELCKRVKVINISNAKKINYSNFIERMDNDTIKDIVKFLRD